MMKKASIIVAAVLSVSLLAGCVRGAPAPQLDPPQLNPPTPVSGDALNLYDIDPITLDPAISGEMTSHQYIVQIFSGLVRLDDDLVPAPDIARDWQLSPDGLTYTFYLRDDVKFQSGRAVTAGDFQYSWERACDPAIGSQTAATYLGDIVGVSEVLAGQTEEISGVKVTDDHTLEVTIDAPKTYFLAKLAYPTSFVVDRDNVTSGGDWWRQPNGTGPFKLKEWQQNNSLVLEKNEDYYGEPPSVRTVNFQLYGGVPINLYEEGTVDVAGVSIYYIDKATDERGPFYQDLRVSPELSLTYLGFNLNEPPFDDVNVRRAFSLAVDKDKLASLVFRDMVEPAYGILPPGMPGYNEDLAGLTYDPEEARALITSSKYGDVANLPPITITVSGRGGLIANDLEAIIHEWRQNLGVEVTVRQLEPQRFLYHLTQEVDQMYSMGWIADYPHPQNFLDVLFRSDSENNYGGYRNAEVDELLTRAGVEPDSKASLALYQQAEELIVADAACLPLWFGKNYYLVKPRVSGYEINPLGQAVLSNVSLAQP
jgi:oligopeptide transport system substrate-binding protein